MAKQDDCCKDALDLRIKAEAYARETEVAQFVRAAFAVF